MSAQKTPQATTEQNLALWRMVLDNPILTSKNPKDNEDKDNAWKKAVKKLNSLPGGTVKTHLQWRTHWKGCIYELKRKYDKPIRQLLLDKINDILQKHPKDNDGNIPEDVQAYVEKLGSLENYSLDPNKSKSIQQLKRVTQPHNDYYFWKQTPKPTTVQYLTLLRMILDNPDMAYTDEDGKTWDDAIIKLNGITGGTSRTKYRWRKYWKNRRKSLMKMSKKSLRQAILEYITKLLQACAKYNNEEMSNKFRTYLNIFDNLVLNDLEKSAGYLQVQTSHFNKPNTDLKPRPKKIRVILHKCGSRKRQPVTVQQYLTLLRMVIENPILSCICREPSALNERAFAWEQAAVKLNSVPGGTKTTRQWENYWRKRSCHMSKVKNKTIQETVAEEISATVQNSSQDEVGKALENLDINDLRTSAWEQATAKLNSIPGGVFKPVSKWRKHWLDRRYHMMKRNNKTIREAILDEISSLQASTLSHDGNTTNEFPIHPQRSTNQQSKNWINAVQDGPKSYEENSTDVSIIHPHSSANQQSRNLINSVQVGPKSDGGNTTYDFLIHTRNQESGNLIDSVQASAKSNEESTTSDFLIHPNSSVYLEQSINLETVSQKNDSFDLDQSISDGYATRRRHKSASIGQHLALLQMILNDPKMASNSNAPAIKAARTSAWEQAIVKLNSIPGGVFKPISKWRKHWLDKRHHMMKGSNKTLREAILHEISSLQACSNINQPNIVNAKQHELLLKTVKRNPFMVSSTQKSRITWKKVANHLNVIGVSKTWLQWKNYWLKLRFKDLKIEEDPHPVSGVYSQLYASLEPKDELGDDAILDDANSDARVASVIDNPKKLMLEHSKESHRENTEPISVPLPLVDIDAIKTEVDPLALEGDNGDSISNIADSGIFETCSAPTISNTGDENDSPGDTNLSDTELSNEKGFESSAKTSVSKHKENRYKSSPFGEVSTRANMNVGLTGKTISNNKYIIVKKMKTLPPALIKLLEGSKRASVTTKIDEVDSLIQLRSKTPIKDQESPEATTTSNPLPKNTDCTKQTEQIKISDKPNESMSSSVNRSESHRSVQEQELEIKRSYYERKLSLMERQVRALERIAGAVDVTMAE